MHVRKVKTQVRWQERGIESNACTHARARKLECWSNASQTSYRTACGKGVGASVHLHLLLRPHVSVAQKANATCFAIPYSCKVAWTVFGGHREVDDDLALIASLDDDGR